MSTATRPYPIVQDLIESFASWLKHRRELNEMRQLDRADFNRIAQRSPDRRLTIWRSWSATASTPPTNCRRCSSSSASAPKARRAQPLVLRDMERVCALCSHKGQCDRDLADGTAAENTTASAPMPTLDCSIARPRRRAERASLTLSHRRDRIRDRDRAPRHVGMQPLHHAPSSWIAPRETFSGNSNAAMILRASATSSAGGVKIALQASIWRGMDQRLAVKTEIAACAHSAAKPSGLVMSL